MKAQPTLLTGLDAIRDYLNPWVAFIISLLALLAFWPKMKASLIGKLTIENIRLRKLVADMTVEEVIKNVIIANNRTRIEELELKLISIHKEALNEIEHSRSQA